MAWTLISELLDIAQSDNISQACRRLNLDKCDEHTTMDTVFDWAARGAESYTYAFKVVNPGEPSHTYLLKSFTPYSLSLTPSAALEQHLTRSQLLNQNGVRTPLVHGARNGTALMQYIEWDLADFLLTRGTPKAPELLDQSIQLLQVVFRLGFKPVEGWLDLRTDGSHVYLVDLGSDLGPPGKLLSLGDPARTDSLRRYLMRVLGTTETDALLAQTRFGS